MASGAVVCQPIKITELVGIADDFYQTILLHCRKGGAWKLNCYVKNKLIDKFADRSARVGVVGMGYVGLPLAVAFAEVGFEVVGVDVDERKVACLRRGESYIEDVPSAVLAPLVASGHLRASADYGALAAVDAISICVPTPLRKTKIRISHTSSMPPKKLHSWAAVS